MHAALALPSPVALAYIAAALLFIAAAAGLSRHETAVAGNIAGAMDGVSPEVEERVYQYWTNVDEWLGAEVRKRFTANKGA